MKPTFKRIHLVFFILFPSLVICEVAHDPSSNQMIPTQTTPEKPRTVVKEDAVHSYHAPLDPKLTDLLGSLSETQSKYTFDKISDLLSPDPEKLKILLAHLEEDLKGSEEILNYLKSEKTGLSPHNLAYFGQGFENLQKKLAEKIKELKEDIKLAKKGERLPAPKRFIPELQEKIRELEDFVASENVTAKRGGQTPEQKSLVRAAQSEIKDLKSEIEKLTPLEVLPLPRDVSHTSIVTSSAPTVATLDKAIAEAEKNRAEMREQAQWRPIGEKQPSNAVNAQLAHTHQAVADLKKKKEEMNGLVKRALEGNATSKESLRALAYHNSHAPSDAITAGIQHALAKKIEENIEKAESVQNIQNILPSDYYKALEEKKSEEGVIEDLTPTKQNLMKLVSKDRNAPEKLKKYAESFLTSQNQNQFKFLKYDENGQFVVGNKIRIVLPGADGEPGTGTTYSVDVRTGKIQAE